MHCVWQGLIRGVEWPRHEPAHADLGAEFWSGTGDGNSNNKDDDASAPPFADLTFEKYLYLEDVPLWAICGPEVNVLTRDDSTVAYFSEFAGVDRCAQVGMRVRAAKPDQSYLVYVIYEDNMARVVARPLLYKLPAVLEPRPASIESAQPSTEENVTPARSHMGPLVRTPLDATKALQQTVLGALRLRGIKRDNPEFKQLYHIVFRTAEFSLRKVKMQELDLETIQGKVDAILAIVE